MRRTLDSRIDELFPVIEILSHLGFAELKRGDLVLTAAARVFAEADTQAPKNLFAERLLASVPLAQHICHVLDERGPDARLTEPRRSEVPLRTAA
jgi:NitT/TauT family transport system ATP-binding protein